MKKIYIYITIDNALYKVSEADAKLLDSTPLNDDDLIDKRLNDILEKYKPIVEHIKTYNTN